MQIETEKERQKDWDRIWEICRKIDTDKQKEKDTDRHRATKR